MPTYPEFLDQNNSFHRRLKSTIKDRRVSDKPLSFVSGISGGSPSYKIDGIHSGCILKHEWKEPRLGAFDWLEITLIPNSN